MPSSGLVPTIAIRVRSPRCTPHPERQGPITESDCSATHSPHTPYGVMNRSLEVVEPAAGPLNTEAAGPLHTESSLDESRGGRPLNVTTSFLDGDVHKGLSLNVRVPSTWDRCTVLEAIVAPFLDAYDARHPGEPASQYGPFTHVMVLVWAGPLQSPSDRFRESGRDGEEDIKVAERPIYCLLDANEPVSVLRSRCQDRREPAIAVELIRAESTALIVQSMPSTTQLLQGEQLLAMLQDVATDTEDMHALVDAATAAGELEYLGLATARDHRGRNCLHLAATRGDATLCRKLLQRREDLFAMDSNRDTALHMACLAGRQVRPCTRVVTPASPSARAVCSGGSHQTALRAYR